MHTNHHIRFGKMGVEPFFSRGGRSKSNFLDDDKKKRPGQSICSSKIIPKPVKVDARGPGTPWVSKGGWRKESGEVK